MVEWSYGLLKRKDQRAFRTLGIFVGGFSAETAIPLLAEDSNDADAIDSLEPLVARSLVCPAGGERPRYRMPEILRRFALDRRDEIIDLARSNLRR
jgi:hypothetical protein